MVEVYFKSLYDPFEGMSRVYYSLSSTLSKRKKMQRAKRQKKIIKAEVSPEAIRLKR